MSSHRAGRAALAFVVVTCVIAPLAYMSMFSVLNAYDDEGYFLITLRSYLSGHALLTQVSTIYGPFYYETMAGLFKLLGVAPGHDTGRFVTLAVWLIASLVSGLAAYRMTRNLWLGVSAQLVTFHVLAALISEPMHPSGLVGLLLMCLAAAAAYRPARPRATAALIGAIVGALCLVKINVGAFAAVAVGFAFAGSLVGRWRRFLLPLIAALVAALPLGLMASLLSRDWVLEFALVVAISGAAVGIAGVVRTPRALPAPSLGWLFVGGAVVVVACLGVTIGGGTGPNDLLNGLVLVAWRLPQLYVWQVRIGPIDVVWAALCLGLVVAMLGFQTKSGTPAAAAGVVRVVAGLLTWMFVLLLPSSLFLLALPLAWVATQAPREPPEDPTGRYARLLLPALAVLESLQAYPVAGTQLSLATLALVPVGAISLGDGIRQLRHAGSDGRAHLVKLATWAAPAALVLNIAALQLFGFLAGAGFTAGTPLALPGAQLVRVPAQRGTDLRALVAAIDRECSTFITLPGLTSFYLWTGQEAPAQLYSLWMFVQDDAMQQSVVQRIENRPRLCVVKNQSVIDFWSEGRPVPSRPLVEFIQSNFVDGGTYGDYQLLVRR